MHCASTFSAFYTFSSNNILDDCKALFPNLAILSVDGQLTFTPENNWVGEKRKTKSKSLVFSNIYWLPTTFASKKQNVSRSTLYKIGNIFDLNIGMASIKNPSSFYY